MSSVLQTPPGYCAFNPLTLRDWIETRPALCDRLGSESRRWRIDEVGDGNLNLVFLVRGPAGGLCIKQSLPYVRVAGESWPLPLERAWFEQRHMVDTGPVVPGMAPALIDYDPVLYAIVMELLPRHKILRLALIDGERHEQAVRMVADYAARATFHTSVLARPFEAVFDRMALYARNLPLTRITVDLVFTEPYIEHPRNRWTSPQLDDSVAALRHDVALKRAAARLGHAFLTRHEALLHGDLHTGSVMVARQDGGGATADDTRVIDPEFALYGPIGFDLGAFVANLLMAYLAQPGHAAQLGARADQAEWVLTQVGVFWRHFAARFEALWIASSATPGADAYPATLFTSPDGRAAMAAERARTLNAILVDLVGFAGIEIIRRTVGFAHNRDFEAITDPDRRADAEHRALRLARRLLVEPEAFDDISDVEQAAREIAQAASG